MDIFQLENTIERILERIVKIDWYLAGNGKSIKTRDGGENFANMGVEKLKAEKVKLDQELKPLYDELYRRNPFTTL